MISKVINSIIGLILLFISGFSCYSLDMEYIIKFESVTGFDFPDKYKVLKSGCTYPSISPLVTGEGEFFFILKIDKEYIKDLLANDPPWGMEWQEGPVSGDYGLNLSFGYKNDGYGKGQYFGSEALVELLSSSNIRYCAVGQKGETDYFYRNGKIIIIDLKGSSLWLAKWDT